MLFSRQLRLTSLIEICRTLRHNLTAGMGVREVFRQLATRGSRQVQSVAGRIAGKLDRGESLESALADDASLFPPLFVTMAIVGEQTGHLPEMFQELEQYFQLQQQLKRQFLGQCILPVIQFIMAVFVVAIVIYVLGEVGSAGGMKLTVFGLSGPRGAMIWLGANAAVLTGLYVAYVLFQRGLRQRVGVERMLLCLPVVGPCLRAFALARFALALQMTLDSELPIARAARLSLEATGNRAFAYEADRVAKTLKKRDTLTNALEPLAIFPVEFKNIVAIGEEAGNLPEVLKRRSAEFNEEAARRLAALTKVAGFLIWLIYGVFVITMIFRLFSMYLGMFDQLLK